MKTKLVALLAFLLASTPAHALFPADTQNFPGYNMITNNPGFENGTTQWTASAGTFTTSSGIYAEGLKGAQWTPAASGNTLTSAAAAVGQNITQAGRNGVASCMVRVNATGYTLEAVDNSSNILVSAAVPQSATGFVRVSGNFVFPNGAGATVSVRLKSGGTTIAYMDSCYLGPADGFNLSQVSQAQLVGTVKISNCSASWTTTSTSLTDASAQTGCSYVVTGSAQAPSTQIPGITFSALPPGDYVMQAEGSIANATAGKASYFQFWDGTNVARESSALQGGGSGEEMVPGIHQSLSYTAAQSNVTLRIRFATDPSGTAIIRGTASTPLVIKVFRYPSSSEIAYRPDAMPASWSGYHGNDCLWTRSSTAYGDPGADASCTFTQLFNRNFGTVSSVSGSLPGIVFTPARAGRYLVCASAPFVPAANTLFNARLTDGTTAYGEATATLQNGFRAPIQICGIEDAPNTSAQTVKLQWNSTSSVQVDLNPSGTGTGSVFWTITALDQSFPAPTLVGSVTSGNAGAIRAESAYISNAAGTGNASCTASQGTGCSWISSVGNAAAGGTQINFVAGQFSAAPVCTVTNIGMSGTIWASAGASSSSIQVNQRNQSFTDTDADYYVTCMGPR